MHLIHRDIKPDNFCMGLDDNKKQLYLIDYGLSKKFRSTRSLKQTNFTNRNKFTGTLRYCSLNALCGYGNI